MSREPVYQDVMGQFPQLKTYNHGTALFRIEDDAARDSIVRDLEEATAKIEAAIPWLAQQVVHEDIRPGYSGTFRVAPWPNNLPPNRLLRVKDCTELCPSYEELSQAQCAVQMLDGNLICPVPGFPMTYDESKMGPAPACLITINFIRHGVLLTFSNQHNVMDGTGIFQVVGLLALILNGKPIPQEAIEQGNRDPSTVVPLYHSDEPIRDHSYLKAAPASSTPPPALAPAKWAQIRFLRKTVPSLKQMATDPKGNDAAVPFISAGDAISALYWKCLAQARIAKGQDPRATSKFSRSIDSRGALKVPTSYMGQMVYFAPTWLTHQELVDLPLSAIASHLRRSLNEVNNEHAVRSYATYIAGVPDKTTLAYTGPFNRALDIPSSSMAQAALVLKFGALGYPEYIRRPNLTPIPGTLYFYPPEASGDLNLLVCLNEHEMEFLKKDPVWSTCTEFIG
ncbi:MAG: hypothetical protein Q9165_008492 [Trypethelium subeluteriae]